MMPPRSSFQPPQRKMGTKAAEPAGVSPGRWPRATRKATRRRRYKNALRPTGSWWGVGWYVENLDCRSRFNPLAMALTSGELRA